MRFYAGFAVIAIGCVRLVANALRDRPAQPGG